mgnify:CR=1 FL=1
MRMFNDATNWKKTGDRSLTFSYPNRGEQREQPLEKRSVELWLQFERLSLFQETSWQFQDRYNPEKETSFSTREYIGGSASLTRCRIHGIALDDTPSVAFVRLDVSIYPVALETLKETTHSSLSFPSGKVPEGGILKDSLGELVFYWADDEVHNWPELYAKLHLDDESFSALARNIQAGGIRAARMKVLGDLFGLKWGGIPGADDDYVILLEDEGPSKRGRAKARLGEILLEWSPALDTKMGPDRDERSKVEVPTKGKGFDEINLLKPDVGDSRKQEVKPSRWSSFLRRPK